MLKGLLALALVAVAVMFVVNHPAEAATLTKDIGNGMLSIGSGFGDFFARVVS